MSDVLTAEEREVRAQLRRFATGRSDEMTRRNADDAAAIIDRLVREVKTLREQVPAPQRTDILQCAATREAARRGMEEVYRPSPPRPTDAEIYAIRERLDRIKAGMEPGSPDLRPDVDILLAAYDAVCRERDAARAEAADWRKGHDRHAAEVSRLTRERDEARAEADAFRTALESISQSGPVFDAKGTWSKRVRNTASAALYAHPRPAAKEEGR